MENKINQNLAGLNLDSVNYQVKENMITFALNANVQSHDGNSTTYTNEPSNQICYDFNNGYPGYKIVGTLSITEQSKLIVFLAHPDGRSVIGEITNLSKDCTTLTETEKDCGCVSGTVVTSTVGSQIGISADTCCLFTPLIVDSCCKTDVGCYRFAVRNNGQYQNIEYIDCNGDPQTVGILLNGYYGFDARSANYTSDIELLSKTLISQDQVCGPENCCLKLSVDFPVYAEYRVDNCETKVYFVARNIAPRYFSIEEPLGRDQCGETINQLTDACERLKLFPDFCQPDVFPTSIDSGGRLKGGVYSFSVAYADENGKEITDYVDFSNPIPIFERTITEQTEYETSKSIRVSINHKTTIFDYFNLVVAENINEVTTYHLVGTYRVNQSSLSDSLFYSGDYSSTFSSIVPLIRSPHYESAEIIEKQNDILMLADLVETPKYNFQPIASQIKLKWETVSMPVDKKFDYSNPEVAYFFRTYQRDEVYPFGIKFKLKNGKYTDVFHIPGRLKNTDDQAPQNPDNKDVFDIQNDCIKNEDLQKWQVYNTGSNNGTISINPPTKQEEQYSCAITSDKAGDFAFWESIETYPCYEEVWGTLAGQPIRHHKFPDSALVHIHKDTDSIISPIGVRVQEAEFESILAGTNIYDPLNTYGNYQIPVSELVCGYELVRGNRVNNKSVIAKGLVYDVGTFQDVDSGKKHYYPNYPYNDLGADEYLKSTSRWYELGNRGSSKSEDGMRLHDGFKLVRDFGSQRFTFHSPDTHFQYPKIGTELKIETVEYGKVKGHFVPVLDHPKYKLVGKGTNNLSAGIAAILSYIIEGTTDLGTTSGTGSNFKSQITDLITNTSLLKDLIEKALPFKELAWQYNSVGTYNKFQVVGNTGNKRRALDIGLYANDKIVELNDDAPLHNRLRETSVYLKTNYSIIDSYPSLRDTTRFTISQAGLEDTPNKVVESDTRAFYSSIKRNFPNQYGQIENIKYVSTGYSASIFVDEAGSIKVGRTYYPAFGGDTYINQFALKRKHSFFTRNLANLPAKVDNVPFDYWLFPNLGYPTYYTGNSSEKITAADITGTITSFGLGIAAANANLITSLGAQGQAVAAAAANTLLATALASIFNDYVSKVNLDDPNSENSLERNGFFYTASYGIPIFYVESDINVDLRHGRNDLEENFYPNVGEGIPDEWLHEVNVPIKFDNFYHYNATYSAQNLSPNLPYRLKYPSLECLSIHNNRVIYSDPANSSNYLSDAWRVFRPGNFYDFPKQGGRLIDLNAGEQERVYARFENTTKVYNSRITLTTNSPYQLEIGNAEMFKQKPVDLAKTDLGYIGTQHKAYVKCEYGTFWVDAKRGHIYQITGEGFNEIKTESNFNWFKQNLPFQILKDIPNADIDNPPIGLGIVMGWDERYERVFITKLDYRVKPEFREGSPSVVKYITDTADSNYRKYVLESGSTQVTITFGDSAFFENKSWTVAYSPKLKNFISFYSFLPNFFVPLLGNFQTIINTSTGSSTWNHNLSVFTYQTYYNVLYPYIIEYNVNSFPQISTVNSVTLMQDIQEYYSDYEYYSLSTANKNNLANFTKAIIYNKEQSSGIIKLIPEEFGNTRQKITYPRMTTTGIEALISRREHLYTFNGFWNVAAQGNGQPLWSTQWSDLVTQYPIDKVPNLKSVRPVSVSYQKNKIKSDFAKVRLIQDQYSRFKFINTIQITQTNP